MEVIVVDSRNQRSSCVAKYKHALGGHVGTRRRVRYRQVLPVIGLIHGLDNPFF